MIKKEADYWTTLRTESVLSMPLFDIRKDIIRNERTQKELDITVMEAAPCVNVIAITPEHKIVFARQHRFGIGSDTLELPGGIIEAGESPLEAAKRELEEETSYIGSEWEYIGKVASNPVFIDSYIHHCIVRNATALGSLAFDDGEHVFTELYSEKEVKKMITEGVFLHPHTLSFLARYFLL